MMVFKQLEVVSSKGRHSSKGKRNISFNIFNFACDQAEGILPGFAKCCSMQLFLFK